MTEALKTLTEAIDACKDAQEQPIETAKVVAVELKKLALLS